MEGDAAPTRSARSVLQDVSRAERGADAPDAPVRVLVTGANGQLGRALIERLTRCEPAFAVRAVVRSEVAAAALGDLTTQPQLEIVELDLHDAAKLADAARGCHCAVHLVGILKESASRRYHEAHEQSAQAIARAAATAGLHRIVYLSIVGSHPASPNACLASKGRAEQILLEAETPVLILRLPMVIGIGDATARILRREALARVLPLAAGGRSKTQPIYAGDVIDAIVASLGEPVPPNASRAPIAADASPAPAEVDATAARAAVDALAAQAAANAGAARAAPNERDDRVLDLVGPECVTQRELVERAAQLYDRRPFVVSIPKRWLLLVAGLAERWLANPPLTRSALEVILADDELDPEPARRALGIRLTPLDETLRRCVDPSETAGEFARGRDRSRATRRGRDRSRAPSRS
jgi:uncharacterized protein YbjT (DUF2867 family)